MCVSRHQEGKVLRILKANPVEISLTIFHALLKLDLQLLQLQSCGTFCFRGLCRFHPKQGLLELLGCFFFWAESCFPLMFCFSHHGKIFLFGSHWNHLVVNYPDFIRQLANQLSVFVCVSMCVSICVCVCGNWCSWYMAGWLNISLPTQNDCW